jgi:hypothetical protein
LIHSYITAAVIGFILSGCDGLAPLHEFGHWLWGGGEITSWTTCQMEFYAIPSIIAGYWVELIITALTEKILHLVWKRRYSMFALKISGFFAGYSLYTWFSAFNSKDFRVLAIKYGATDADILLPWLIVWVVYFTFRSIDIVKSLRYH